jgi:ABC-2 type transport system permease protein
VTLPNAEAPTLAIAGVSHRYVARPALVDVSFSEQINRISLAVVCGCTALFMVGGIAAYDPSRGLLARRGEP